MLTFRILGPLEVVRNGDAVPLGPAKQRAFLACLLLHHGETVSIDRLTDELWGEEAPPSAEHNLHVYVSRLRKVIADEGRVVLATRAPGYALDLESEDVLDAVHFEGLVGSARDALRSDPAEALELLERGLALWRGPALADFAYESFAEPSIRRLEELRAGAEESRIEALLALGRESDAIPEVEALVQRFPLREHLRALQMLALYRAGRQSEALGAFQAARQALAAELGIDPGPELRTLEEAILRHDPGLQGSSPRELIDDRSVVSDHQPETTGVEGSGDGSSRRRAWRRPWLISGAVIAAVAIVIVGAVAIRDEPPTDEGAPAGPTDGSSRELLLDWHEASPGDFIEPGAQRILGGIETSTGFLVFGYTTTEPTTSDGRPDLDTAAWVGDAEQHWEPVQSGSFVAGGNQRATGAVEFANHEIVMAGSDQSKGNFDGAAWIMPAGSEVWARAGDRSGGLDKRQDQMIRDVVRSGQTLFAVGFTERAGDDAAVWESKMGRRWAFAQGGVPSEDSDQQMTSVDLAPTGVVIAGGWSESEDDRDAAVWTWKAGRPFVHRVRDPDLGGPGDQQINAITVGGPGFVAVGQETIDGDTNAVVWTSADGHDWAQVVEPSAFGGDGAQEMFAVSSSETGIIAAGSDRLPAETDPLERGGHWDAAVWTSLDGVDWIRLPGDDPSMTTLTDLGDQEIKGLISIEGGILALGAEAGQGSDWDGRVWIGERIP